MNETTIMDLACELAEQVGKKDALNAIGAARGAWPEHPVTFITGNSHMPPLRAYGRAEDFWAAAADVTTNDECAYNVWEAYSDAFHKVIEDNSVYIGQPEYDNAIYVVDLNRFTPVEEPEGDDLSDEWEAVVHDSRDD